MIARNSPIIKVEEFHRHIEALVSTHQTKLDEAFMCPIHKGIEPSYQFRFEMIEEENNEYLIACGRGDVKEILDALVDLQYFLFGTVVMHGFQDVFWKAFDEIHRSNMTKTANGNRKALKGTNYSPPNLEQFIRKEIGFGFPDDFGDTKFTFNTNRNIKLHNQACYNSIDLNTNKYWGKEPAKMICTLENCVCKCHKE